MRLLPSGDLTVNLFVHDTLTIKRTLKKLILPNFVIGININQVMKVLNF